MRSVAARTTAADRAVASSVLPLIDAHVHYNRGEWDAFSVCEVVALMDRAGITRAFVSSAPDEGTSRLYDALGGRVVPFLRPYRTIEDAHRWTEDPTILEYVSARLGSNVPHVGLGEFRLLAGAMSRPVPRALVELARERSLILHAHADAVAINELLAAAHGGPVLWAHAGITAEPAAVAKLLDQHPNLYADLALRDLAPQGHLSQEWSSVLQAHPQRFLYGTDTWNRTRWRDLAKYAKNGRKWLMQLPEDTAALIAHANAEQLLLAKDEYGRRGETSNAPIIESP